MTKFCNGRHSDFYRPHPKDGEGNVFILSTPGGGGQVSPAGGGSGQSSRGGVRSVQPGGGQVSQPTGGGSGQSADGGVRSSRQGGVRSVSRWGGQVQLAGGVRSSCWGGSGQSSDGRGSGPARGGVSGPAGEGGGSGPARGGSVSEGGVSILRPLAGGMPLAFTQEDFLVLGYFQMSANISNQYFNSNMSEDLSYYFSSNAEIWLGFCR